LDVLLPNNKSAAAWPDDQFIPVNVFNYVIADVAHSVSAHNAVVAVEYASATV
jgi:hypothetical protein